MIHLRNLCKIFGEREAVKSLTLDVPEGEIFGLLGHNGAGKSTTIGMMLGQVWPTSGEIRICGFDITSQRQRALHQVGAIFETPVFYDYLSGWRNLEILSHYTASTSKARIREILDWVGLTGREGAKVRTYSHGMRTRLALAQALLPNPKLLILDEPSDGLDPEGIHEMRQTILRLQREMRLTILLSSHLLVEVEQLCTRIAVMNQGRLVFEGPIASARRKQDAVRLKTSDFAKATAGLQAAGLITGVNAGESVFLPEGVTTDQLVRWLVKENFPVHEIFRQEQTLEDFYLGLMKPAESARGGGATTPVPPADPTRN